MDHYPVKLIADNRDERKDSDTAGQTRRFLEKAAVIDRLALLFQAIPGSDPFFFHAQIVHNDSVRG